MNRDLDAALQDLAQHAASTHHTRREDGTGVSTSEVVHRVRRRRHVRVGFTTATALVAVTGLVLAGAAIADRRDPLPADSPTLTPSPSVTTPAPEPSPTTPAVALPTGDPALPFGVCGSVVGSPTEPATDPSASIAVSSTPVADHGGVIETSVQIMPPLESWEAYQRTSGPQIVITRDDVVVATIVPLAAQYDEVVPITGTVTKYSTTFMTHNVPVVCDDGSGTGPAGAPLPPGDYRVMAVGQLWWTTHEQGYNWHPSPADMLSDGWEPVSVVGGAAPLHITDHPAEPTIALTGAPPLPPEHDWQLDYLCEEPPASTTTPALTASGSPETRSVSSGERMRVDVSMAFAGPGRVSADFSPGPLMLRREGQTIGVVSSLDQIYVDASIDAGSTIPLVSIADDYQACGEELDRNNVTPIPAGTYEAYPMVSVYVHGLYSSDGELLFTEDEVWSTYAVSTPFTLVVN